MIALRNLELHIAHGCNLACESCSHYSNQGHAGLLALEEAERWMQLWHRRLRPRQFSLLGGEPSLHPRFAEFIPLARRYWPAAHLRLVSNGFFLHRHPWLPAYMQRDHDTRLYISIHHNAPEYRERLRPIEELLDRWRRGFGISVKFHRSYSRWTRRYHGFGASMQPYQDGDPRGSWSHCPARTCPQIHEGKIWKCAPLAYLPMQHAKYGLGEAWRPYLAYEPLSPDCTDDELRAFFAREEESYCGMCPAQPERFTLPLPLPARRAA